MSITLANKDDRTSLLILSVVLGVAATAFLDAMNYLQHIILDKPLTQYEFIGRWVIYMTDGVFSHQSIKAAPPKAGELMLGWVGHYAIGIGFALLMLIFTGVKWVLKPSFLPAFIVGFATCSIPFFLCIQEWDMVSQAYTHLTPPCFSRRYCYPILFSQWVFMPQAGF